MALVVTPHGNAISASSLVVSRLVLSALFALLVSILTVLLLTFPRSIVSTPWLRLRRIDTLSQAALCLPHAQSAQETGKLRTLASRVSQQWLRGVVYAKPCSHLAPISQ